MASPTDIRKGRVLLYQNVPHLILEMLHRTQGRQAGFVQVTMRNLHTSASTTAKFRSTDNVEFCHVSTQTLEFSYVDQEGFHFLNPETYEYTILSKATVEDQKKFLVEGQEYDVLFVDDKAVQIQLPASVEIKVSNSPEGLRGDSVSSAQKPATLESGLVVQVPLFIKEGDIVKISTDECKYLGRIQ
ncbi:MAG: elongation factor P [Puniceicoccales bacterium]|jgi:elongation factor P|nr:elongation factor P [Puniceicoccales bacterium]